MTALMAISQEVVISKQTLIPVDICPGCYPDHMKRCHKHSHTVCLPEEAVHKPSEIAPRDLELAVSLYSQQSVSFAGGLGNEQSIGHYLPAGISDRVDLRKPYSFAQSWADSPNRYVGSPLRSKASLSKKASILTPSFGSNKLIKLRSHCRTLSGMSPGKPTLAGISTRPTLEEQVDTQKFCFEPTPTNDLFSRKCAATLNSHDEEIDHWLTFNSTKGAKTLTLNGADSKSITRGPRKLTGMMQKSGVASLMKMKSTKTLVSKIPET